MTIDKTYSPADIEARWYPHWESRGAFRPERPDAEPFTIVIPPTNVTGSLHIGQGLTRQGMGREAFVATVWDWKEQSGGTITRQLRRLGASCDWAHERFTMDPGFSSAVIKVFVELHRKGLLYRDKRLVNWDPKFGTAISDLEVETNEVAGKFWTLRYPLADGSGHV